MASTQAPIAHFQGWPIYQDPEEGFWWRHGGYHDTREACEREIADHNQEALEQAQREGRVPYDSPCLEAPWWATP